MTRHIRHFQLNDPGGCRRLRVVGDRVDARKLGERKKTVITVLRTGEFSHPSYGDFTVDRSLLEQLIANFESNTYGQRIALDVAHKPENGAAGYFTRLFLDGNKLRGEVELTEYGIDAVQKRGFIYVSADYTENYRDHESKQLHGPLLFGAGLVVRPHVKGMDPVQLSEGSGGDPVVAVERVKSILLSEAQTTMKDYIKKLGAIFAGLMLADSVQKSLTEQFEAHAKLLGEDTGKLDKLLSQYEETAQKLSEQIGSSPANVNISLAEPQDTPDIDAAVARALSEAKAKEAEASKKLAEGLSANRKTFDEALENAEGLSDDLKKQLGEARELITADMTTEQVKKLAEHQVKLGNDMIAKASLASMGFHGAAGSPRIDVVPQGALRLGEELRKGLKASLAFANGELKLSEKTHPFVERVLGEFDRIHGARLEQESRILAGAETNIGDTNLPYGVVREVIREALSDLNILSLVQTLTDPAAQATTQVPYEQRDTSAVVNGGIVFEGQGIPGASIKQAMDLAYILPRKLAMKISNEVMHFSRASVINWDAYGRNVASNARVMRELIAAAIANEMQRKADAYGATTVSAEDIAGQLDGSNDTIKTAEFPIVRPYQQYDLQGNTIGSASNPISILFGATPIEAYDGTGTQSAGTYYRVTNYNLGYIQFVDEAGTAVTPNEATATIDYDYATNVAKFDLDFSGVTEEVHLNGLLRTIGRRKAVMSQDRYIMPNFLLMSPTLNDTCTNAEQFAAERMRDGSDTSAPGDLATVKGISAYGTNAPGIDLGDERILMGVRGTTSYVIAKPFMTGTPFEAVDSLGRPTGEKVAYGEEYSSVHTPLPIASRYTSVIAYSATGR